MKTTLTAKRQRPTTAVLEPGGRTKQSLAKHLVVLELDSIWYDFLWLGKSCSKTKTQPLILRLFQLWGLDGSETVAVPGGHSRNLIETAICLWFSFFVGLVVSLFDNFVQESLSICWFFSAFVARAASGITSITTNGNNNGATMPSEKNTNKCSRIWSFLHKKQQDKDGKEIAELIMGGGVPALGREGGFQI